ncbi:MAG TPA: MiaB/RimO family radical SAM methylthiotransferase [Gemmatimonadaceae bacterium]|nr:MiaB/RimO family radical SAM methylthiotransferase [Gemmatimonadaceae bacterium]
MKVYLATFGCRANQYDSEAVRAMLRSGGCELASSAAGADVAIFNSCTVTARAEADLRQSVRRAARTNPALRTVVMGCAAAVDDGSLASLPSVTHVVPGADVPAIAAALELPAAATLLSTSTQTGARALLRIQDGCDEHCTFCLTTIARGTSRSRAPDELVGEATALAEHHPEIVLTGIHIGGWGADLPAPRSLGWLLERLVRALPGVRFRLSSIEATEVDATLGRLLTGEPERVAPHLHAPLQSGSDRVLRRMGRHWYTASRYAAAVEAIAGRGSVFALGADVIAGFPGETERDHRQTVALLGSLPVTYLHVFPYSPRPGTGAARLPGRLPPAVVSERAAELRDLGRTQAERYRASRHGGTADVVLTAGGTRREGLTEDYLTVVPRDQQLPRGARVRATLELDGATLYARQTIR